MKLVFIILLVLIIVLCYVLHIRIDIPSFFRPSIRAKRGLYGTYAFCGPQGKGKTTAICKYCLDKNKKIYVFSNVNMVGLDRFFYFDDFQDIYDILHKLDNHIIDTEGRQVVFIFDEIFTLMTKSAKLNKEIQSFLCQLRKRKIIFLTTCQSWAELPLSFRRLCRFEIDCEIFNFPLIPIFKSLLITTYKDAERMKWDEIEQDHVAPIVWTRVALYNKRIAKMFDTRQLIKSTNF